MQKKWQAIGLMSGSSLDGLDIAFCEFWTKKLNNGSLEISEWQLLLAETIPFSEQWIGRLVHLTQQTPLIFAQTHTYFGHYLGELVYGFLKKHQIQPDFIASHGHTIFHDPGKKLTVQIGDGAALASMTGYPVICDFRAQDVALSGEGAPLAPLADKLLFGGYDFYLNLGGIANISCDVNGKFIAFDISGANQGLNALAGEIDLAFDEDGKIAANGRIEEILLDHLNAPAYFQKKYPKSLSNQWVQRNFILPCLAAEYPIENKLRTACEHIAVQVAQAIGKIIEQEKLTKEEYQIFVTGGGAFNGFLMKNIEKHCRDLGTGNFKIIIPDSNIIEFKEAILMTLMGILRLQRIPNCLKSVTGARRDTIGGAVYLP